MATGLSGIASGFDTNSVVDQLMALERRSLTKYTHRQRAARAEQTALRAEGTGGASTADAKMGKLRSTTPGSTPRSLIRSRSRRCSPAATASRASARSSTASPAGSSAPPVRSRGAVEAALTAGLPLSYLCARATVQPADPVDVAARVL